MSVTAGSLLQYKEEHYGRYYRSIPKVPFENRYEFLKTINNNVLSLRLTPDSPAPSRKETARKKYVLFCSEKTWVQHPLVDTLGCYYIKCFISDPYDNDTTDGWLREEWVEPLNQLGTYYEENVLKVRKHIKEINQTKKFNVESYKEFKEIIASMKNGRF